MHVPHTGAAEKRMSPTARPTPTSTPLFPPEDQRLKEVTQALAQLQGMGFRALRAEHRRLLGFEARSKNLIYLRRRLAGRLQELVDGGLSDLATLRLQGLMPEKLPARKPRKLLAPPRPTPMAPAPSPRDPRLPEVGTVLQRAYQGVNHRVDVLGDGFLYRGTHYTNLSALAREITGTTWNG